MLPLNKKRRKQFTFTAQAQKKSTNPKNFGIKGCNYCAFVAQAIEFEG
jgi:hypothetical protein